MDIMAGFPGMKCKIKEQALRCPSW